MGTSSTTCAMPATHGDPSPVLASPTAGDVIPSRIDLSSASTSTLASDAVSAPTTVPAPVRATKAQLHVHHMVTRSKTDSHVPNKKYAMLAASPSIPLSPLPKSMRATLVDPNWRAMMQSEFDVLTANRTWTLVPRPPSANVVTRKWVFKHKFWAGGSFEKYKARWVVHGFTPRLELISMGPLYW
jgi:hypothetical protein